MHIYDFLTDEVQYQLKAQATIETKTGRFEDVLKRYKAIFLHEFGQLTIADDSKYLSDKLKAEGEVAKWFDCFLTAIRTDEKKIEKVFDEVLESYDLFNRSKHYLAVLKMHDLLEYFDLLAPAGFSKIGAFYRGRPITLAKNMWVVKEGTDCRTKAPYLHLAFNLRRLVGNQRFSFSGIPILYLGSSVMTVYYELRETDLNSKEIGIAQYGCNQLVSYDIDRDLNNPTEKHRYFDITNDILDLVNDMFTFHIQNKLRIPACDELGSYPGKTRLITAFRRLILSHLCTFPRSYDSSFSEEYVIPQLLTESVRIHKFDGILFPSTQFGADKKIEVKADWQSSLYKSNLAIFAEYHETLNQDKSIEENYYLEVADLKEIGKIDYDKLKKEIDADLVEAGKKLGGRKDGYHNARTIKVLEHIYKKLRFYECLFIDGQNYLDTFAGKIELVYLSRYLAAVANKALQNIPAK